MFCMLGGIFAFRWLSYSVAGRGIVNVSTLSFFGGAASMEQPELVMRFLTALGAPLKSLSSKKQLHSICSPALRV